MTNDRAIEIFTNEVMCLKDDKTRTEFAEEQEEFLQACELAITALAQKNLIEEIRELVQEEKNGGK